MRGEGQVKDSVLQMLGPLVFGECMASSGNELGWGMGAYRFLGVDLKPEGPSLCSHGLTNSLGQPTVPTHVGVCMSVCVCTVCACLHGPVHAGDGSCMQVGQLCAFTQTQVPSDTLLGQKTLIVLFLSCFPH